MKRLRRRLGLERCLRCHHRELDWWLGRANIRTACQGPCTYETVEGLK